MKSKTLLPIFTATMALGTLSAYADWIPTAAGTYEYNDTANWDALNINDRFSNTFTGMQTATFNADRALSGDWQFLYDGAFNLTLNADGVANREVTLAGNINVDSVTNGRTVTFGSTTALNNLNIELGGVQRTFTVATGDSATFVNGISGGTGVSNVAILKQGAGTLNLTSTIKSFTGDIQVNAGAVSVENDNRLGAGTNDILLRGGTFRNTGGFTLGSGRFIGLGTGNTGTINVTNGALVLGSNNQLTGTGATLNVTGNNTLTLSGSNSFSGQINNSTSDRLRLQNAGALGTAAVTLTGGVGATRRIEAQSDGAAVNFGNNITVASQTARFTGGQLSTGTTGFTMEYGSLTVSTGNSLIVGDVNSQLATGTQLLKFTGTHTLTGNAQFRARGEGGRASVNIEISGAIGGAGTLSTEDVSGAGELGAQTLSLTGTTANTYTGVTSVNAGTLFLNKTSGVNAIAGDGVAGTADIIIGNVTTNLGTAATRSTLGLGAADQIADSVQLTLNSEGTFALGMFTESFDRLNAFTDSILDTGSATGVLTVNSFFFDGTPQAAMTYTSANAPMGFTINGGGSLVVIPEPTTNLMLLGGLGMLCFQRSRRQS